MIKKIIFIFCGSLLVTLQTASAEMLLFVRESCIHCQNLGKHLEENDLYEKYDIKIYEISKSKENFDLYFEKALALNYRNGGVPWLVNGNDNIEGTDLIITYLQNLDQGSQPLNKTVLSGSDSESLNSIIKQQVKIEKKQQKEREIINNSTIFIFGSIIALLALIGIFAIWKKR